MTTGSRGAGHLRGAAGESGCPVR